LDRVTEFLERKTADEFGPGMAADRERYEILSGMETNAAGLVRYWKKRADAEGGVSAEGQAEARGAASN
jgi:hypothetical protein